MHRRLPALRRTLDLFPSPVEERPGLLLRDPFAYTEDVLILPPPLVPFLQFFDGRHEESELADALYQATGDLQASGFARRLAETLSTGGFLENQELERRRHARHRAFAESVRRAPSHAGQAYPDQPDALRALIEGWLAQAAPDAPPPADAMAIAAPHVSLEGGFRSYATAYRALPADAGERTFVVLGTSHYGSAERFGLTRKAYETPYGTTASDPAIVERLASAAADSVVVEDYCHAVEHSIEFQVLFLQHLYGPAVRVVPILCGPFAEAARGRGVPEDDPAVARMLDALAELHASEGRRLAWVLGVDLAHVGRRYGGAFDARAGEGPLLRVAEQDRQRLRPILDGDARAFWAAVQGDADELGWCGSSALYAFLRAAGPVEGTLLRYEQWNIDPASVVSFAALAFAPGDPLVAQGES